jgi:tetratricopeptide (TPR) repeat protein
MTPQPAITDALRRAIAAAEAGRFAQAETDCAQILAANPGDAGALALAGALTARRGDLAGAVARYRAALAIAPRFVKALSNLGAALSALGQGAEAERHLALALAEDPAHGPALINLGQLLLRQDRAAEAIIILRRAAAAAPTDAMAWNNLGGAHLAADRHDEARDALERALALDPASSAAWSNLGAAHYRGARYGAAVDAFRAALAHGPSPEIWTHLGTALRGIGEETGALAAHDRALAGNPALAEARFNRALLLLGLGRFAEGWADYRARASGRAFRARHGLADTPRLPPDMTGRRVRLLSNQGFGDELFFLRFAPALKRRGATIVYRAAAPIAALVRPLPDLDEVVVDENAAAPADLTLLVDDLPYALATADTPPSLPLAPEPALQAALRQRLAALGPPPYLGVTWRGGIDKSGSLFKLAPRAAVARLAGAWPGTVLMLQRRPLAGELDAFVADAGRVAHDFAALHDDLGEMLALLSLLDDYVAVSNTNVHLRQALGRPSRVLVPMPADWRWMAAGNQSPWFPGCALYRQAVDGSWDAAFADLARDLAAAASGKG